ncbi:RNA polymerase sigma factor [Spirosoma aerolatum]|uniref:RNA polymerase sigma factor n=1 Tax=Spirosoma aerolatum TaxID=1211326 RepID=UPI0009AEE0C1|nr:sigma factor-like helix-turn-helix DNA-binding protein [Spirosoma aerolatum]
MKIPIALPRKQGLLGQSETDNQLTFSMIYDRYAAALLGVIHKIIPEKAEAVSLLETTFSRVRSELPQFKPTKQPLFIWLLQIARCTALEALKERSTAPRPTLQLTETGQVVRPMWGESKAAVLDEYPAIVFAETQQKQLLDMVLFKNCTPEEAARSLGIPVETVRQQLRLAMQQVRNTAKAS